MPPPVGHAAGRQQEATRGNKLRNKVDVITFAVRNPSPGGIRTRVCTDPWSAPLLDMRQWSGAGLSTANIHGILSETET